MTKLRKVLFSCATICAGIVLALVVCGFVYGSPALPTLSHGPVGPPPCDGTVVAHGPVGPPPCDGTIVAHGPVGPPPCDGTVVAHGPVGPPPCDGTVAA